MKVYNIYNKKYNILMIPFDTDIFVILTFCLNCRAMVDKHDSY